MKNSLNYLDFGMIIQTILSDKMFFFSAKIQILVGKIIKSRFWHENSKHHKRYYHEKIVKLRERMDYKKNAA